MVRNKTDYCNYNMTTKAEHPVWNVYDEFRTARLNSLYYESELSNLRRYNFWLELILTLSVSSGVAGLWFLKTPSGAIIWNSLVSLAAVLAVVKPLVKLSDQIQQRADVITSWRLLDAEMRRLTILINERGKYDDELQARFHTLMDTKSTIIQKVPFGRLNNTLRQKCFEQVIQELPTDGFFIPEEKNK